MASSDCEELHKLVDAATNPFSNEPLWPNPEWTQEAAMIAFLIHHLREEVEVNRKEKVND